MAAIIFSIYGGANHIGMTQAIMQGVLATMNPTFQTLLDYGLLKLDESYSARLGSKTPKVVLQKRSLANSTVPTVGGVEVELDASLTMLTMLGYDWVKFKFKASAALYLNLTRCCTRCCTCC